MILRILAVFVPRPRLHHMAEPVRRRPLPPGPATLTAHGVDVPRVVLSGGPPRPKPKPREDGLENVPWTCIACKRENPGGSACRVCYTKRDQKKKATAQRSEPPAGAVAVAAAAAPATTRTAVKPSRPRPTTSEPGSRPAAPASAGSPARPKTSTSPLMTRPLNPGRIDMPKLSMAADESRLNPEVKAKKAKPKVGMDGCGRTSCAWGGGAREKDGRGGGGGGVKRSNLNHPQSTAPPPPPPPPSAN